MMMKASVILFLKRKTSSPSSVKRSELDRLCTNRLREFPWCFSEVKNRDSFPDRPASEHCCWVWFLNSSSSLKEEGDSQIERLQEMKYLPGVLCTHCSLQSLTVGKLWGRIKKEKTVSDGFYCFAEFFFLLGMNNVSCSGPCGLFGLGTVPPCSTYALLHITYWNPSQCEVSVAPLIASEMT